MIDAASRRESPRPLAARLLLTRHRCVFSPRWRRIGRRSRPLGSRVGVGVRDGSSAHCVAGRERRDHGRLGEQLVHEDPDTRVTRIPATGHPLRRKGNVRAELVGDVGSSGFLRRHGRELLPQVFDNLVVDNSVELPGRSSVRPRRHEEGVEVALVALPGAAQIREEPLDGCHGLLADLSSEREVGLWAK